MRLSTVPGMPMRQCAPKASLSRAGLLAARPRAMAPMPRISCMAAAETADPAVEEDEDYIPPAVQVVQVERPKSPHRDKACGRQQAHVDGNGSAAAKHDDEETVPPPVDGPNPLVPEGPVVTMGTSEAVTGAVLEDAYGIVGPGKDRRRRVGVLMHPTSLPGPYGSGELGVECNLFVDWLRRAGMQAWQVLPLVPPDEDYFSPYSSTDTNCGNPLLISLDELVSLGLLEASDLPAEMPEESEAKFKEVFALKTPLLEKAAVALMHGEGFDALRAEVAAFRKANAWVEESALFDALRRNEPGFDQCAWWDWPEPLRFREPEAITEAREKHADAISKFIGLQFLFNRQWSAVKAYANSQGISLIGDMPIYVGGNSADVWANRELFELSETGAPAYVSGVPPDAFSKTGQLWGSPLYDWAAMKADGYKWWANRLERAFQLFDETRIDHFRAFAGYWCVEATQPTAVYGCWRVGPGRDLFDSLNEQLGGGEELPIMAEDLGVITQDVIDLREEIGAPGMVVLQFAWGSGATNTHLPHNHYENAFCYPGTHDNETTVGWWKDSAQDWEKDYIRSYTGMADEDISLAFVKESCKSIARTVVVTMQDMMRLDNSARMNTPGKAKGNWAWRIGPNTIWSELDDEIQDVARCMQASNRLPPWWDGTPQEIAWREGERLAAIAGRKADAAKWIARWRGEEVEEEEPSASGEHVPTTDPLEDYCSDNPETDECRVYEE